jgi:hypothetical protein
MWRVVRAARPVGGNWAGGAQVRVSNVMRVPVSFASTVLCPSSYTAWSARKLQAVMLHEGSHVAHVDSYVLLLAAINRAIFGSTHYMVAADSPSPVRRIDLLITTMPAPRKVDPPAAGSVWHGRWGDGRNCGCFR